MTSSPFHTHFEGKESHTTPQAHRLWSTTEDSCLGVTSDSRGMVPKLHPAFSQPLGNTPTRPATGALPYLDTHKP